MLEATAATLASNKTLEGEGYGAQVSGIKRAPAPQDRGGVPATARVSHQCGTGKQGGPQVEHKTEGMVPRQHRKYAVTGLGESRLVAAEHGVHIRIGEPDPASGSRRTGSAE
jgi:hypothetical protein